MTENVNELLQTVRQIEVAANRLASDMMVGAYLSSFKGRGMDFEELREYAPGDDVRHIDWNVTNRLGRPFVKRHREEREMGMLLLVDISGSGDFAFTGPAKRRVAAQIAGALAFAAARSGDKVGLVLFTDEVEFFLPPARGRRHLLRLLREILFFTPARRGTNPAVALRTLLNRINRRAMAILISDLLCPLNRELAQALWQAAARHDVICVHLYDPCEAELPPAGIARLADAETDEILEINLGSAALRQRYAAGNAERFVTVDQMLAREGVDTVRLRTDEPFAAKLQHFFEHRRWHRA